MLLPCVLSTLHVAIGLGSHGAVGGARALRGFRDAYLDDAGQRLHTMDDGGQPLRVPKPRPSNPTCEGRDPRLLDKNYMCSHSLLPTIGDGVPAGAACRQRWPKFFREERMPPLVSEGGVEKVPVRRSERDVIGARFRFPRWLPPTP